MNNISEEELLALQAHVEVEASQWEKLKKRIFIRAVVIIGLFVVRALMLKLYPQNYESLVYDSISPPPGTDLGQLIYARLLVGAAFSVVYLFALRTNSYLRTISIIALKAPIALIWGDLQMFLVSSFPDFTLISSISFGLRLVTIYLLLLNYLDIRK